MKNFRKLLFKKRQLTLCILLIIVFVAFGTELFVVNNMNKKVSPSKQKVLSEKVSSSSAQVSATSSAPAVSQPLPVVQNQPSVKPSSTQVVKSPKLTSPKVKIAFGVESENFNNQNGELSSLQQTLGVRLSSISVYKEFGGGFNPSDYSYIKANGSKLLLAWEPWDPNALTQIINGSQDSYIQTFASAVSQYGGPVTIRFGHEMNGDWYPWGNKASDYINAYRHLHSVFQNSGVSNVTWMWCPNAIWNPNSSNLDVFYPGSDVVDVIGIDGFNYGTTQNYGGWQSFATVFGPTYQYLTSRYSKPFIIAETSSVEFGGDKTGWVNSMFDVDLPQNFPKIQEVIWFNILKAENGGQTTDWRLNSSSSSQQAFQNYFQS